MDAAWDELVGAAAAPPAAVELCASARERAARELAARPAERLAALPAELDVVVEASGFLVLHFLGVASVLDRAPAAVRRYAGASSGAMTPASSGPRPERTLELYASYGALSDAHRAWSLPASAWRADRHWRRLAGALFPDGADGDAAARAGARARRRRRRPRVGHAALAARRAQLRVRGLRDADARARGVRRDRHGPRALRRLVVHRRRVTNGTPLFATARATSSSCGRRGSASRWRSPRASASRTRAGSCGAARTTCSPSSTAAWTPCGHRRASKRPRSTRRYGR